MAEIKTMRLILSEPNFHHKHMWPIL